MYCLVQLHKLKVILIAACLLVVESIDALIGLLQFLRTIVEWVGGVLQSRHGHNHVWCENGAIGALDTFRLHLKNPTHSNSFLGYTINAVCTALPVKEQR